MGGIHFDRLFAGQRRIPRLGITGEYGCVLTSAPVLLKNFVLLELLVLRELSGGLSIDGADYQLSFKLRPFIGGLGLLLGFLGGIKRDAQLLVEVLSLLPGALLFLCEPLLSLTQLVGLHACCLFGSSPPLLVKRIATEPDGQQESRPHHPSHQASTAQFPSLSLLLGLDGGVAGLAALFEEGNGTIEAQAIAVSPGRLRLAFLLPAERQCELRIGHQPSRAPGMTRGVFDESLILRR